MSAVDSNYDMPSNSSAGCLDTPTTISSTCSDSSSIQSESERFNFALDNLSKAARRMKDASGRLPLVSSLKASMGLLIIVVEDIRAANKNRDVWTAILECLGDCIKTVLERVEMLLPSDELCRSVQHFEGSLQSVVREMDSISLEQTNWIKTMFSSRSMATRIQNATTMLNTAYSTLQVELLKYRQSDAQETGEKSEDSMNVDRDSDNKTLRILSPDESEERTGHPETNQATLKHQTSSEMTSTTIHGDNTLMQNQIEVTCQDVHNTVLLRATEDRDGQCNATSEPWHQDCMEEFLRFEYTGACKEASSQPLNEKQIDMADEIIEWSNDWNAKPIFNVVNLSTSGMSVLSQHLVRTWSSEDLLIGRFFFSAPTSKTGKGLASTLARDIALSIPSLRQPILDARRRNPNLENYSLQKQLEVLVFIPLMALRKRSIIVIDALDQCRQVDRRAFLESLHRFFASCSPELNYLKIFLTCTPEQDILRKFGQKEYRRLVHQTNFSVDLPEDGSCFEDCDAPTAHSTDDHPVAPSSEPEADSCHRPQSTFSQELIVSSPMTSGLAGDNGSENRAGIRRESEGNRKGSEVAFQDFSFEGFTRDWGHGKNQGRGGGIAIGVCAMNGGRVFGTGNTFIIRGNKVAYTAVHGIGSEVNITNSNIAIEATSQ